MSKKRMGIFVVGLIVILLLGLGYYYSAGPETGASTVTAAVRGYLSVEQKDALSDQLNRYAPDTGGAGITLQSIEFPVNGAADTSQRLNQLVNEIKSGPSDLILLDKYVFDLLGDERLFEDLSVLYPGDPAVTAKYLYAVNGKEFADAKGLEELPELYLVVRSAESGIVNKNAQTLGKYTFQNELLANIANNRVPS